MLTPVAWPAQVAIPAQTASAPAQDRRRGPSPGSPRAMKSSVAAAVLAAFLAGHATGVSISDPTVPSPGTLPPSPPKVLCRGQLRFDVLVCASHMCTKCTLEFCMNACQKHQEDFPGCRCADWPAARKSYSGGEFEGKGE